MIPSSLDLSGTSAPSPPFAPGRNHCHEPPLSDIMRHVEHGNIPSRSGLNFFSRNECQDSTPAEEWGDVADADPSLVLFH